MYLYISYILYINIISRIQFFFLEVLIFIGTDRYIDIYNKKYNQSDQENKEII